MISEKPAVPLKGACAAATFPLVSRRVAENDVTGRPLKTDVPAGAGLTDTRFETVLIGPAITNCPRG
jgi:hypothetical protein